MKRTISIFLLIICLLVSNIGTVALAKEGDFTRGSFSAKLVSELGLSADFSDMKDFLDLPESDEYYKPIMIMCKLGNLNPFEDGTFRPHMSITRAEAAAVITRMLFNTDFEMPTNPTYPSDVDESSWYSRYAWKIIDSQIMSLTNDCFNGMDVLSENDIDFAKLKSYAGIVVTVDGNEVIFDVQPQIIDGRTMVPVRGIFEALNATVEWDGDTQTVISKKDDITIKFTIDAPTFKRNNEIKKLDVPAQILDGRTLVPVRAIGESFDCTVDWDGSGVVKKVIIKSNKKEIPVPEKDDTNKPKPNSKPPVDSSEEIEEDNPKSLSCSTSLSHSCISIGGRYRIVYALTINGDGGAGNYKYKFDIYENGEITESNAYGRRNEFEGEVVGSGNCTFKVYVKDADGNVASKEIVVNE